MSFFHNYYYFENGKIKWIPLSVLLPYIMFIVHYTHVWWIFKTCGSRNKYGMCLCFFVVFFAFRYSCAHYYYMNICWTFFDDIPYILYVVLFLISHFVVLFFRCSSHIVLIFNSHLILFISDSNVLHAWWVVFSCVCLFIHYIWYVLVYICQIYPLFVECAILN